MSNSVRLLELLMFEVLHLGSFFFFLGKQGIISANFTFTRVLSFLQSTLEFCSITNPCRVLELPAINQIAKMKELNG